MPLHPIDAGGRPRGPAVFALLFCSAASLSSCGTEGGEAREAAEDAGPRGDGDADSDTDSDSDSDADSDADADADSDSDSDADDVDPCDADDDGVRDWLCGGEDCEPDDPALPGDAEDCHTPADDDCDGGENFSDEECQATNDTCETALEIGEQAHVESSTEGIAFDYPGCGADVVYSFVAGGPLDASFTLTLPVHPDREPLLPLDYGAWVTDECPPLAGGTCSCAEGQPGLGAACELLPREWSDCRRVGPGTHYLIVSVGATGGGWGWPFWLDTSFVPSAALPCAQAPDVSAGGSFSLAQDGWSNALGLCGARGGPEALFSLVLPEPSNVLFASAERSGVAYLLDSCDVAASPRAEILPQANLPAGTYTIVKELGAEHVPDPQVQVTVSPPGDACAGAMPIAGSDSYEGTTAGASRLAVAFNHWSADGPEAVYELTLTEPTRVWAELEADFAEPILYVQPDCGVSATSLYQWFERHRVDLDLEPGTYYVVVDGERPEDAGDYTLNLALF